MQRLTVQDAAELLGITTSAVRSRLSRGTLQSVKESGTVYVLLPVDPPSGTPSGTPSDISEEIAELKYRVAYLRGQLDAERQFNAELRRSAAALPQHIPELSAPPPTESRESPTAATIDEDRAEPRSSTEGAHEGAQEPAEPRRRRRRCNKRRLRVRRRLRPSQDHRARHTTRRGGRAGGPPTGCAHTRRTAAGHTAPLVVVAHVWRLRCRGGWRESS